MRKPRLLILDEPFVGLDPQAAFVMKGYLRQVCSEGGSVLFSKMCIRDRLNVDRERNEIAVFKSRGASSWQIFGCLLYTSGIALLWR